MVSGIKSGQDRGVRYLGNGDLQQIKNRVNLSRVNFKT